MCLGHVLDLREMVESLKLPQTKPHPNYHPYKDHFLLGICRTKDRPIHTFLCSHIISALSDHDTFTFNTCDIPGTNYLSIVRISSIVNDLQLLYKKQERIGMGG